MGCDFQMLSLAYLKQQTVGASGKRVREVWDRARKHQPAIIFIDECEGILGRRGAAETDALPLTSSTHFWPSGMASEGMRRYG